MYYKNAPGARGLLVGVAIRIVLVESAPISGGRVHEGLRFERRFLDWLKGACASGKPLCGEL